MINRRIFFHSCRIYDNIRFFWLYAHWGVVYRQRVEAKESRILEEFSNTELIVREYEGRIGIYKGDSPKPFRVIDFHASLLSDYDRQQLSEGIVLKRKKSWIGLLRICFRRNYFL